MYQVTVGFISRNTIIAILCHKIAVQQIIFFIQKPKKNLDTFFWFRV